MRYSKSLASFAAALTVLVLLGSPSVLGAQDLRSGGMPIVKGIEVDGLKRIGISAVTPKITQQVGDYLSPEKVSQDIKSIYAMGYFTDVRAEIRTFEGGVDLIFVVKEKPTIRNVDIFGNDGVSDDKFEEALTISPGSISDTVLINDNANNLKAVLQKEGYPSGNVVPIVSTTRAGSTVVTYLIEEGEKVKIREISFEGNENIKSRKIKKAMDTSEWWWLSFLTGGGRYEKEKISGDMRRILELYYDNGYLEAAVTGPGISYSEDKLWMDIKYSIKEGSQYHLSSVEVAGNTVFGEDEMMEKIGLAPGDVASKGKIGDAVRTVTDDYSEKSYAMANVFPDIVPDEEKKEAAVRFRIREGDPYTVGKINISGNIKTKDKVIRREVRLDEGEAFNGKLLKRSYNRIVNLKYFENVKLKPVPRVSEKEMDINIEVDERSTGSLILGVGYSSTDKFVAMVEFSQGNLWGTGQSVKLDTEFGNVSATYELTYTEPWFMDREISFSSSIYRTDKEYDSYEKKALGFSVGWGKSFWEYWGGKLTYKLENVEVFEVDEDASSIVQEQEGIRLTSSITPAISRDSRDNVLDTHTGSKNKVYVTFAGLGGDNKFYKVGLDTEWFIPVSEMTTLALRGRYAQGAGIWGETLPLYERFDVGGITTVRGYRDVGPEDEAGDYIGGERMLIFNADYVFPVFPEMKFKGVVFFDAGSAFDEFEDVGLKYSTGLGVRWISPIGPLRLEWAYDLNPEEGDPDNRWEFSLGTFF